MTALNNLKSLLNSVNEIEVEKIESKSDASPRSIGDLYIKVSSPRTTFRFQNHKHLGMFGINEILERENDCSPQYLNLSKHFLDCDDLNISLDGGYENSSLIVQHFGENGYKSYRMKKYEYFLKWIIENDYIKKIGEKGKPTFIGFSGNIAQLMITPFEIQEDWVIHVVRHNNIIFIDKVAAPSLEKRDLQRRKQRSRMAKEAVQIERASYHAHKFLQLLLTDSKDSLNENLWRCFLKKRVHNFLKYFDISEADFGDHSFLILHELKAVDPEDDNAVEVKLIRSPSKRWHEPQFRNYTVLQMWGRAVVAGANKTICGERQFGEESAGFLKKVELYTINDFESMKHNWSPDVCYNFLDRLLNYILLNVPCDSSLQTYQLTWKLGENKVTCEKFDGELFVPSWFPWSA